MGCYASTKEAALQAGGVSKVILEMVMVELNLGGQEFMREKCWGWVEGGEEMESCM